MSIGDGFWTFANSNPAAPTLTTLMAAESAADTFIPSFMDPFWNDYANKHNNTENVELISINNVHVHNFNIQPLTEIDIQFQAQPQEWIHVQKETRRMVECWYQFECWRK